jgi:ABC-2 type transport system permease protein
VNPITKLGRDTWLTFQYETGLWARSRTTIAASFLQPVTFLLFFTPFLKSVLHAPSYGAAYQGYVPLLLCSMGLFGGLFSGFALLAARRQGVIGRFRVTPLSRSSPRPASSSGCGCSRSTTCWP